MILRSTLNITTDHLFNELTTNALVCLQDMKQTK